MVIKCRQGQFLGPNFKIMPDKLNVEKTVFGKLNLSPASCLLLRQPEFSCKKQQSVTGRYLIKNYNSETFKCIFSVINCLLERFQNEAEVHPRPIHYSRNAIGSPGSLPAVASSLSRLSRKKVSQIFAKTHKTYQTERYRYQTSSEQI